MHQVLDTLLQRFVRLDVLHVSNMMAEECNLVAGETERILELASDRQYWLDFTGQFDRIRCISTAAA